MSLTSHTFKIRVRAFLPQLPVYILLLIFAVLVLVPLGWAVLSSFKDTMEFQNPFALPNHLKLANYRNAWVDAHMGDYFLNSVYITAIGLVLLVLLAVPCGYVLSRFKFRFNKLLATLMMAGIFINVNYIVVPIYTMLAQFGGSTGIRLLNNKTMVAVIYAVTSVPFAVYLLSGYFKSLPTSYEEAAKIDGCGYFGTLFRIIMPLTKPSIITVLLFNFMKFWNEFLIALTFLTRRQNWTLAVGLLDLMEVERIANDYGRLFAGLVIVMLPTLILYCLVQDKLTKGIAIGGIKG